MQQGGLLEQGDFLCETSGRLDPAAIEVGESPWEARLPWALGELGQSPACCSEPLHSKREG